jgi:hypothetical protein
MVLRAEQELNRFPRDEALDLQGRDLRRRIAVRIRTGLERMYTAEGTVDECDLRRGIVKELVIVASHFLVEGCHLTGENIGTF